MAVIWSDTPLDPRVAQALIAGAFVALGWLVNGQANRRRDAALRTERVRDVQRALFAEIRAYLAALKSLDLTMYGGEIERRILTEPGYFPVIPTEKNDSIFKAIISDIHVLPRQVVDPVVLYYSQIEALHAIIADLRALDVSQIGPQRAAAIYRDYIRMKRTAIDLGEEAMLMMGAWLTGGQSRVKELERQERDEQTARLRAAMPHIREDLRQMRERLNNPASGRSFR